MMSNITVCSRFRPLSAKERKDSCDSICISSIDSESFIFKDEKDECTYSFDKVFYEESMQADVYEFLALPIVKDAVKGVNGTIITYGQTGAGKTYSVEGPSILECDVQKKGLLPRVVDGLFECIKSADESTKYTIKLSMVEIYMEKVRDLLDLTKDNIQIKENKEQEILLSGVTEGGNSRTALLCCCSPSASNASETLSTIRFGMRAKHIKASPLVSRKEDKHAKKHGDITPTKDESCDRILNKLRERLEEEDVKLLEELFILEGLFFDVTSGEDLESAYQDVTSWTISSLQQAVEELIYTVEELKRENKDLKARLADAERFNAMRKKTEDSAGVLLKISGIISFLFSWAGSFSPLKMPS
ncbi:hypothetical protein Peur_012488 [Populus x canadensis]